MTALPTLPVQTQSGVERGPGLRTVADFILVYALGLRFCVPVVVVGFAILAIRGCGFTLRLACLCLLLERGEESGVGLGRVGAQQLWSQ